jgi:quinol monooxygenase YgiN
MFVIMKHTLLFTLTFLLIMAITPGNAQTSTSLVAKAKDHSVEIIRYNIPADQHANFEEAYRKAGKLLDASAFCLGYEVIHGEEEPDHYIVVIDWTSTQDHMTGFRNSPQFMPFFDLVKPFYTSIEEMKHYKTVYGETKP